MKKLDKYKNCDGCDSCQGARYCFGNIEEVDQYSVNVTYNTWDRDALDAGDTDDRGLHEQDRLFESIGQIHGAYRDLAGWDGWSDSYRSCGWIYGTDRGSRAYFERGETTNYNIHITRQDGADLSQSELDELSYIFNL